MFLSRRSFLVSGIAFAAGTFSSRLTLVRSFAGPIVETAQGKVQGIVADNGINVFKGMRYAASSAGPLRFMPPTPPPKWAGVQDAFEYGDQSPQARGSLAAAQAMSDDCLRINVWTPGFAGKRPVLCGSMAADSKRAQVQAVSTMAQGWRDAGMLSSRRLIIV
jgi:para-nitrobenzyl esterase